MQTYSRLSVVISARSVSGMPAVLPPRTVFLHKETLHRIELPPLANFLHSLTVPAQLIKLNDILDRYRTPSSVHRVDIREVQSSELPPGDTEPNGEPALDLEETGEPIELDENTSIEEYRATSAAVKTALGLRTPSPEATHPLPPSGPRRRVRELRLDLRTLDAAALFALEKWRRQVLQLESLPFENPDSIWYQNEPEPEPEAEPVEEPDSPVEKPARRSRKSTKSTSVQVELEAEPSVQVETAYQGQVAEVLELAESIMPPTEVIGTETMNGVEAFDAMVDDLESITSSERVPHRSDANGVTSENVDVDQRGGARVETAQTHPATHQPHEKVLSRSPTPDQLLPDGFDVNANDDSDYAPEPTPPPRVKRRIEEPQTAAFDEPYGVATSSKPGPSVSSAFTRVPSPVPMMAIASGSRTKKTPRREDTRETPSKTVSRSPSQRVSLSPLARSVSPQKRPGPGASSNEPIELSVSPEQPPPRPARPLPESAFVPFVREQMRIPESVVVGRSKPSWLHTDHHSSSKTGRNDTSRPVKRRPGPGPSKRPRLSRDLSSDEIVIVDYEDVPPIRSAETKSLVEEDEWADFRF